MEKNWEICQYLPPAETRGEKERLPHLRHKNRTSAENGKTLKRRAGRGVPQVVSDWSETMGCKQLLCYFIYRPVILNTMSVYYIQVPSKQLD